MIGKILHPVRALNAAYAALFVAKGQAVTANAIEAASSVELTRKIKMVTASLWEQTTAWLATPLGVITATVAAIALVLTVVDSAVKSAQEWREEFENLKAEVEDNESEIESLNSQLTETSNKIAEIRGKGTLTLTDQSDLKRLKEENFEIAAQIEYLKEENKLKKENALNALYNSDKAERSVAKGDWSIGHILGGGIGSIPGTIADFFSGNWESLFQRFEDIEGREYGERYAEGAFSWGGESEKEGAKKYFQSTIEYYNDLIQSAKELGDEESKNVQEWQSRRDVYARLIDLEGRLSLVLSEKRLQPAISTIREYDGALEDLANNESVKKLVGYLSILDLIDWETILGADEFAKLVGDDGVLSSEEFSNGMKDGTISAKDFAGALQILQGEFSKIEEVADGATHALPAFLEQMKLTDDQLKAIKEKDGTIGALAAEINDLNDAYNSLVNGNVDYSRRPFLSAQKMIENGFKDFPLDGIATTYDFDQQLKDKFGNVQFTVKMTPILESGEIMTDDEINEYIGELERMVENGVSQSDILDWDAQHENIIINIGIGSFVYDGNETLLDKQLGDIKEKQEQAVRALTTKIAADNIKEIQDTATAVKSVLDDLTEAGSLSNKSLLEIFDRFGSVDGFASQIHVLTDATSSVEDITEALNELYSAYIMQSDLLQNVTATNYDYVVAQMEALGVTNAQEVATAALNTSIGKFNETTAKQIENILTEKGASEALKNTYSQLAAAFIEAQKQMSQVMTSAVKARIQTLGIELNAIKSVSDAYSAMYRAALKKTGSTTVDKWMMYDGGKPFMQGVLGDDVYNAMVAYGEAAEAQEKLQALINQVVTPNISNIPTFSDSKSSSSKSSQSSKTAGDLALDAWKAKLAEKKHQLEMGQITEAQYYTWLMNNYKKDLGNYAETLDERRSIQEDYYKWLKNKYKDDLQAQKDKIQKERDALKKWYEEQKKLIEDAYDAQDKADKRAEYAKEISDLKVLIATLQRDTTQEAKRRLAEAQAELVEKEKERDDYERNNAKEDALALLEEQYNAADQVLENRIKAIDDKMSNLDDNTSGIYKIVKQWASKNGYKVPEFARGTPNAFGGGAVTQEQGAELLGLNTGNGQFTYLTPHSKVWSAKATEFLYQFANAPSSFLSRYARQGFGGVPAVQSNAVSIGDIVINGSADGDTVAKLRKERENIVRTVLEGFKKLK